MDTVIALLVTQQNNSLGAGPRNGEPSDGDEFGFSYSYRRLFGAMIVAPTSDNHAVRRRRCIRLDDNTIRFHRSTEVILLNQEVFAVCAALDSDSVSRLGGVDRRLDSSEARETVFASGILVVDVQDAAQRLSRGYGQQQKSGYEQKQHA
jgi:hypothetical protein